MCHLFHLLISEQRLSDADVLENVLWSTKSTRRALPTVITPHCLHSLKNTDDRAFFLTQNSISNSPSNFLVYKRKDAKIAWPSAVSLLCKKKQEQDIVSTRGFAAT